MPMPTSAADPVALIRDTIDRAIADSSKRVPIRKAFAALYRYMEEQHVDGGCHALSAMAHVVLRELRVPITLNAGWVLLPSGERYTHSWIEVDGRVFDIACERPNHHRRDFRGSAVLAGIQVSSGRPAAEVYGASSDNDVDAETIRIGTGTISSWLVPSGAYDWFWGPTELVGQRVGLARSARGLRESHGNARWVLRR
jgi:hypothetical protein